MYSDWNGMLIPKRYFINRLKQYYINLGELGKNGKLKIVENVKELYDIGDDLKEDELPKVSPRGTENDKDKTVDM